MTAHSRDVFLTCWCLLLPLWVHADDPTEVQVEPVKRGEVQITFTETGELQAVANTNVFCKLRARGQGGTSAGYILWVIDNGAVVKKGDVLMRLDDAALKEEIDQQRLVVEAKQTLRRQAEKEYELTLKQADFELLTAKENVELVKLEIAHTKAGDDFTRQKLKVRLAQAERAIELARLQAELKREKAKAGAEGPKAALETERGKLRELMDDLEHCTVRAPQDGVVVYAMPEPSRFGQQTHNTIAVGEMVKEGQKLFSLPDLRRMQVKIKVDEKWVPKLRLGQPAEVRIGTGFDMLDQDGKPLAAKVHQISPMAVKTSKTDAMGNPEMVYPVVLALEADNREGLLKQGMSVEATVILVERRNVLRLPESALWYEGEHTYCYVKKGPKHEPRRVTTGLVGQQTIHRFDLGGQYSKSITGNFIEITDGLKEGEEVVTFAQNLRGGKR